MSITIRVHPKFSSRVPRARLTRLVRRALRAEKARGDVTLYVTTDAELRALNRKFHATDAATDVLAFPARARRGEAFSRVKSYRESDRSNASPSSRRSALWKMPRPYIGDIIISYDTARVNARRVGWRIADELELLVAHGLLHLLGYEDHAPRARARMWRRQATILGRQIPS
ncbi:MAG: rRNA maturation RNase YbeY [Chloroflexi bacterium]|nr:rRNA maturation RNase YbeY [Chloroflexota bacterium]